MSDHECRAGRGCRGWARREEPDHEGEVVWGPAFTAEPATLCSRCREHVARCAFQAEDLWTGLHAILGHLGHGRRGRRSPGPKSPLPINVHTDALLVELEDRTDRAAEVIREAIWADKPRAGDRQARVARDAKLVADNVDRLVAAPRQATSKWCPSGETWDVVEVDGVDLALDIVDVIGRARARVGVTRRRDRMPVPCPRCEHSTLGRTAGSDVVDCTTCHTVWSEQEYRFLTRVLAEDYRELAP